MKKVLQRKQQSLREDDVLRRMLNTPPKSRGKAKRTVKETGGVPENNFTDDDNPARPD